MRSSRQSFGGNVLRESNRINMCSPSSFKRRTSFGGSSAYQSGQESVEPKKDRRTMLEEWRAQVRAREQNNGTPQPLVANQGANTMADEGIAPLSLPPPPPADSTTAIERYRLKKLQRQMKEQEFGSQLTISSGQSVDSMTTYTTSASTIATESHKSLICFDDDTALPPRGRSTPTLNRRISISGGARRRIPKGRKSNIHSSINADVESSSVVSSESPLAVSQSNQITGAENGPGLQSRMRMMEIRIKELEKEKLLLSMEKAPLEARLKQKEEQWTKEQYRYENEIDSLAYTSREINERYNNLQMEFEGLQEESRKLRLEAKQKAFLESEISGGSNDEWSRQLQNDRDVTELKQKLRHAEEEIRSLRLEKVSIESEINATNIELTSIIRDYNDLKEEFSALQEEKESNQEAEIQLEELSKEHIATTAQLNATSGELASLKSQSKFDMEQKEKEWKEEKDKLLFELSVAKTRASAVVLDCSLSSEAEIEDEAVLRVRIEERDHRIEKLEAELLRGEQVRRAMHNRIQELRGNIRVFVRTRPFLPGDNSSAESSIDVLPDGENLLITGPKNKRHEFKFDKSFAPSAGQDMVFEEVSHFVQSALDGYHVCLFSYGQTGSGKTHTMQGSGSGAMRGIIPRAVEQILSQAKKMQNQKWEFTISASFLEIYNEELRDLLTTMRDDDSSRSLGMVTRSTASVNSTSDLSIRRERNGKSYVAGLTKVSIDAADPDAGMDCLKRLMSAAARTRSVASTKMNSQSSRSHSVFMLHLHGMNEDSGAIVDGALNLCDLAGSERLDRSGAGSNAKRLKETQAINKSLSCLGDVFNSLANGSSHVPFRNSKLTYLLQDCLSGDGKALMFVNLSPTQESSNESLCSLRFAQRVNQVELGKATKNIRYAGKRNS